MEQLPKRLKVDQSLQGHSDWVTSVAFNHDGAKIASGSLDKSIRVWDVATDCKK